MYVCITYVVIMFYIYTCIHRDVYTYACIHVNVYVCMYVVSAIYICENGRCVYIYTHVCVTSVGCYVCSVPCGSLWHLMVVRVLLCVSVCLSVRLSVWLFV